jgi:radical SAM protein with 4Fe4S-binding SPASM domain
MQNISYADFSTKIHSNSSNKRIPMYGMIEVTRRCPLKCAHCYNNLPLQDQEAGLNELTFDEHCRILDEITGAGCLWLTYTGGEIFVRKDFLEIYTYAKKKGLLITLFTNGTLITPEIADYLAEWRPSCLEITVYGRTRETHERVTGIPGSYDKCLEGIRFLTERKLPLKLKTMALTLNEHEIWQLKGFVEDELGLDFRFDPMINPRLDYSQKPLDFRLPPRRAVELDLQDPKLLSEWKKFAEGCVRGARSDKEVYYCNAGITGFGIDPYGGMNICLFSPDGKYDLRKGSFNAGWDDVLLKDRSRKISRQTKCVECTIREMCGMCPPNSLLEKGDAEEPVDFFCEVAHLRANAFGIPVKPHGECEYCTPQTV